MQANVAYDTGVYPSGLTPVETVQESTTYTGVQVQVPESLASVSALNFWLLSASRYPDVNHTDIYQF